MLTLDRPDRATQQGEATDRAETGLGPLSQIPLGEGRNFQIGDLEVAVFHTRQGVYATQAECPHRKGPLADGLLGGATVLCPFHAWRFDLRTGEALMGQCAIQTYPLRVAEGGEMLLSLTPLNDPAGDPPRGEDVGVSQAAVGSAEGPAEAWPVR